MGPQDRTVDSDGIELRHTITPDQVHQLVGLYAVTWWADGRGIDDVRRMLDGSDLVFGLVERATERLVGFARVLTDGVYRAMVFDVVVAEEQRGRGLGRMLLDAVVEHQGLAEVESLELVCQPELVPFYQRWGFTDDVGSSRMMRRRR